MNIEMIRKRKATGKNKETNDEKVRKILMELDKRDWETFLFHLEKGCEKPSILTSNLSDPSPEKIIKLLNSHCGPNYLYKVRAALEAIPRNDLVRKLPEQSEKAEESESDDLDGCPSKRQRLGKFLLSDLEDYAQSNRTELVRQLEKQLEPEAMTELKESLAKNKLKSNFSFIAKQFYELFINKEVNSFLDDINSEKKSHKIPKKILEILFIMKKTNNKQVKDQKQTKGNTIPKNTLREIQEANLNPTDSANAHEMSGSDGQVAIKSDRKETNMAVHMAMVGGDPDINLMLAVKKWYEKNKEKYQEGDHNFDHIGVHQHQIYGCFKVQDLLLDRLPKERVLIVPLDGKAWLKGGALTKNLKFELQFNMAVVGAQQTFITSEDDEKVVEADSSFLECENVFKNIVFKLVLPILALYKQVKADILQQVCKAA